MTKPCVFPYTVLVDLKRPLNFKQPTPHNTNAETEALSPPTHHAVWSLPGQVGSSESSHTGLGQQWNPAALQPPCHWKEKSFQTISLDSMLSDPTQWYFYTFCLDPLASGIVPKLPYMLLYLHTVGGSFGSFTRLTKHHSNSLYRDNWWGFDSFASRPSSPSAPTMPSFSKNPWTFSPFYLMSPSFCWGLQTLPSFLYFSKITSHKYTIHQLKSMHSSRPSVRCTCQWSPSKLRRNTSPRGSMPRSHRSKSKEEISTGLAVVAVVAVVEEVNHKGKVR